MIKLLVIDLAKDNDMWCNFMEYICPGYRTLDELPNIGEALAKHGAVDSADTPYIIFENEEDAIAFKLKYE